MDAGAARLRWRGLGERLSSVCMCKAWPWLLFGWLVALTANACSIDQRSLGRLVSGDADGGEADGGAEVWVPFGLVTIHPALANATASQADPTLTADELEMYFSSNPNTDWDIWLVQRASIDSAWEPPAKVDELSSDYLDETPEVSADGLTMYLASERPGGTDGEHLWVSHRATRADPWDTPVPVAEFVGGDKDLSPSLAHDELLMAFASLHGTDWDLYATTRPSPTDMWEAPTPITELNSPEFDWDPALYQDGRSIVFASRRLNTSNSLFYASRTTVTDEFSVPEPAVELNVNDDGDPWLSDDGHHIVFDSRRGGGPIKIYEAWR